MPPKKTFVCEDVTLETDPNCFNHINWAIGLGMDAHPEWYPEGTTANATDVQCALFIMTHDDIKHDGHNCTVPPCSISASMLASTDETVKMCLPPPVKEEVEGPSIQWWGWVLIVAAVLGLALAAFGGVLFAKKKKKPKPTPTRATTVEPAAPEETVSLVAPPIYTYVQQPQPVYTTVAEPVYVGTIAAQPTVSTSGLFAVDLNHDGVIGSNEVFAVGGQPSVVQVLR